MNELCKEFEFTYETLSADIDEQAIRHDVPTQLVALLAEAKASALINKLTASEGTPSNGYLITCDQVVVHQGRILEKPASEEEARAFIKSYANSFASTVGSVMCTALSTGRSSSAVDVADVYMVELPGENVNQLVEEGIIFRCAGGLMVEHPLVAPYVTIHGGLDRIMGLDKLTLMRTMVEVAHA